MADSGRSRHPVAAIALFVAALAAAAFGYPGALAAAALAHSRGPQAADAHDAALQWIHVEHPRDALPYLADEAGRTVILRGVVAAGLVDYWTGTDHSSLAPAPHFPIDPRAYSGGACPLNDATTWVPPLCEADLAEMRELGVDVVRLALSWSLLEPRPGTYDHQYIDRVAQVVAWARSQRIRVILDLHQNAYSRYVGRSSRPPLGGQAPGLNDYDGAPAWATLTDGLPSEKFLGQREVNPAVFEAATGFWLDRDGIQEHYLRALAELARPFTRESAVLGYGVFNEPWPGWTPPPGFEDLLLFPFYRRVVDALTGLGDGVPCPGGLPAAVCGGPDAGVHDLRHLVFLEDGLLREVTDFPTHLPLPFTSYGNVVLGLHAYTHIYTPDALAGMRPGTSSWPSFGATYGWGEREARSMGTALFVTEYGNDPRDDAFLLLNQAREQDSRALGSTFWVWKQNCGYGGTWGVFAGVYPDGSDARCAYDRAPVDASVKPGSGCLRAQRAAIVGRPVPLAVPRGPFRFASDPVTGAFSMSGLATRGGELELRLPAGSTSPDVVGGTVVSTRPATVIRLVGGSYRVTVPGSRQALPAGCA